MARPFRTIHMITLHLSIIAKILVKIIENSNKTISNKIMFHKMRILIRMNKAFQEVNVKIKQLVDSFSISLLMFQKTEQIQHGVNLGYNYIVKYANAEWVGEINDKKSVRGYISRVCR